MFTNPFSQTQQWWDVWAKAAAAEATRMDQLASEMHKMQAQAVARTCEAIDESARLMKESVNYASQLSSEWRKITLETTKKAAEMVTPKA